MKIKDEAVGVNEDALRALAQAYDREDAALRGESDPWSLDDPGDIGDSDTRVSERLACARAAAEAFLSTLTMQQEDLRHFMPKAEAAEARNAELVKALEVSRQVLAKLLSAGHNSPSATPEEIDAAFWSVDAALGGQSNET